MKNINTFTMIGRLTKDAEIKKFTEETGVIQFSIACNTSSKKDGKYVDEANFFNVKRYGKNLDKLTEMLVKGKQVCISGYLKQERWENDGKKNSAVVLIAEELELLGGNSGSNASNHSSDNGSFQEDIPYDDGNCPF